MSEKSKTNFSKLGSESGTNFSKLGSESGTNFSKLGTRDDYPGIPNLLRRGAERLETSDVKVFERYRKPRVRDLIPLQGSIQKNGEDWEITVGDGFVIPRHNASGDTGAPITITDLPIEGAELVVVAGDKCYVKLDISVLGKVTTAVFEKAVAWPTDTPPVLAGGDLAGTVGTRHIRILEVIEETTGFLVVNQIHTGHIDHFQPTLGENLTTSPGSNEARVLKQWNAGSGRWDYRYLIAGDGIEITENASTIEVKLAAAYLTALSHPWKATEPGTEFIDIAPGKILGIRDSGTPGNYPWGFVYVSYAGGSVEVTSATGWLYAIIPVTERAILEDSAGAGYISASREPDSVTVVFDSASPATVTAASGQEVCIPIAEVALASGIASVVDQVLTHNPLITIETTVSMP